MEKIFDIPFNAPIAWVIGAALILWPVAMIVSSLKDWAKIPADPDHKSLELKHFIAYTFAAAAFLMLGNSIVLYNLHVFGYADIGFWKPVLMFVGSLISAGVASGARYGS